MPKMFLFILIPVIFFKNWRYLLVP